MRTRTLLMLAVFCGLAILVAGSVQLLRVSDDSGDASADLFVGDTAAAGDLLVTVNAAGERDGVMRVEVTLSGVNDDDGLEGFRLVVPGNALAPLPSGVPGTGLSGTGTTDDVCGGVTLAEQRCTLVFATTDVVGTPRVLLLRRGEDQQRWVLA